MKTTDRAAEFWNCRCTERFVHREAVEYCPICETASDDRPNSTVAEVADQLGVPDSQIRRHV